MRCNAIPIKTAGGMRAAYNKHAEQLSIRGEFLLLISYDGNCKTRCCSIEKAKSFVFSYHLIGYGKQIKTVIMTDPFPAWDVSVKCPKKQSIPARAWPNRVVVERI